MPKPSSRYGCGAAPLQIDTFDPKPNAGYDYCGPLDKPISTNVPGIQIGELLPQLAQQADEYSIIRSMTHGINGHETAAYMMQTGHAPGVGLVYPSLGAIVSLFKGYDHGYTGLIPPYVVITEAQGRFSEEGFLGPRYKPFVTGGDPARSNSQWKASWRPASPISASTTGAICFIRWTRWASPYRTIPYSSH